jgi:hypothetical protein
MAQSGLNYHVTSWKGHTTILNSLENKEFSCFVFYDFSKAFEKVWHNGLVHKMNSYGIKGNLPAWV